MNNREKAIKGLECLTNEDPYMAAIACAENKCPYAGIPDCNLAIWHDALELLKGQEPVPVIITANEPFGTGVWCDCGNCGETLIMLKHTNTEAASKMIRYCRKCGRAVKWD